MFNDHAMAKAHVIAARVDADTKARFRAAARARGVTESALLEQLVDLASPAVHVGDAVQAESAVVRESRLYVRLARADRRLLKERAAARRIAAATYVTLLVASHLREAAPLTKDELAALLRTVGELSAITRQVRATVAAGHGKGQGAMLSVEAAGQILKVCQGLRDHVKALLVASARSWRGESAA
jgi:hypothetical protein